MSDHLMGLWSLTEFSISFPDERPTRYPFGRKPSGFLSYHSSGHMQALLSHQDRSPFPKDLEHAHRVDETTKARAFDESLSYAGRWELDNTVIHHHVLFASNPQIIGHTLSRRIHQLTETHLQLGYAVHGRSGQINYILKWIKIPNLE